MAIKLSKAEGEQVLNNKLEINRCILPELAVHLGQHRQAEEEDQSDNLSNFSRGRDREVDETEGKHQVGMPSKRRKRMNLSKGFQKQTFNKQI